MKNVIYYFSGTGNSLAVARDLANEIGVSEIISIANVGKDISAEGYDTVGIVFPVYMFALPVIVAKFLNSIKVNAGAYVFAVATFGGIPGRPLELAKDILSRRGIKLSAGFGVKMPGNFTPLYGAISESDQNDIFDKEKIKTREIARAVKEKFCGIIKEGPFLANLLIYALVYKIGSSKIHQMDKKFWVNDKCTKCGLCAKICPAQNIELREGRPTWCNRCELCMACLQWCPVEAIQYGKNTPGRKRYHHPDIKANDLVRVDRV